MMPSHIKAATPARTNNQGGILMLKPTPQTLYTANDYNESNTELEKVGRAKSHAYVDIDKLRGIDNQTEHRHTIRSSAGGTNLGLIDNKAKSPIKDNFLMTPTPIGMDLNASKSHILRSQESIEPQGSIASPPPHY